MSEGKMSNAMAGLLCTALMLPICCGCGNPSEAVTSARSAATGYLTCQHDRKNDFGIVQMGSKSEMKFDFLNENLFPVEVVDIATSCDCFRLVMPTKIEAGERITATAIFDLSDDPTFVGKLRLQAKGIDVRGRTVFDVQFNADVKARK